MSGYPDKTQMVEAYARNLELGGMSPDVARMMAADKSVYVPHIYRGGWVIRGFGFSVERVGVYVAPDRAGNPAAV